MNKLIDVKSFVIFLLLVGTGGLFLNKFSGISILYSYLIVGAAILVNGLIIALLESKNRGE